MCLIHTRGAVKWPREALHACNIPGQTGPVLAEHAVGLMLAAAKRAWFQTAEPKAGRRARMDNVYLRGETLGLVGTGAIEGRPRNGVT